MAKVYRRKKDGIEYVATTLEEDKTLLSAFRALADMIPSGDVEWFKKLFHRWKTGLDTPLADAEKLDTLLRVRGFQQAPITHRYEPSNAPDDWCVTLAFLGIEAGKRGVNRMPTVRQIAAERTLLMQGRTPKVMALGGSLVAARSNGAEDVFE